MSTELLPPQPDVEDMAILLAESNTSSMSLDAKEYLDTTLGMYTRELFIPAGHIVIGKQHRKPCINIVTKGQILVKTNLEDEGKMLVVPENESLTFTTEAGSRKIVYAVTDTIVINIWSNIESDSLDTLEEELTIPSEKFNNYIKEKEMLWHGEWSQVQP